MHMAAEGGRLEAIQFLSAMFGDRVHEKEKDFYTPLHFAAQGGHCEVARYLIMELKMDPQDRDKVCQILLSFCNLQAVITGYVMSPATPMKYLYAQFPKD